MTYMASIVFIRSLAYQDFRTAIHFMPNPHYLSTSNILHDLKFEEWGTLLHAVSYPYMGYSKNKATSFWYEPTLNSGV